MLKFKGAGIRQLNFVLTCLLLGFAVTHARPVTGQDKTQATEILAPGWTQLEFEPPEAGSYHLPPLGAAGDGNVLDSSGEPTSLHQLMGDKVVVLSFIYSSCSEANGCPLATHVLERLQHRLLADASAEGVRFISLSFDPGQDTPEVMQRYGKPYIEGDFDWRFLTTADERQLQPILESYGQSIVRDPEPEDGEPGNISHVLRVYLVDRSKRIRNVYSASYLHADTMINDLQTLRMEALANQQQKRRGMQGPGDYKDGYEGGQYQTAAQSLLRRRGSAADLLSYIETPPLGLPPIPVPDGNPISPEKVELGRLLFFDRRLSHNNTISCAMCHVPEQGFSSNEIATAVGIEGRTVRRNSPTIYNVAYLERLFHDGRETSLEQQVWGPLLARNEMGNPSVGRVIQQISSIPEYGRLFENAFNGRQASMETIGMALASYQRLLVSANSPFDRWYFGGDSTALTDQEKAGFGLFSGKARCANCHQVTRDWALMTDNQLHNTGIGFERSMSKPPLDTKVHIAPGIQITVKTDTIAEASEPPPNDLGLYEITENPDDRWKYRTPSLRNIALTAPYMHDGSFSTLEQVIAFYNRGGIDNELQDTLIQPLSLSTTETEQLLVFLNSLTGDNVDQLVSDAFEVPVGNSGSELTAQH